MNILKLFRIQFLQVFTDGVDTYVAYDPDDAVRAWMELTGEKDRGDYNEPFEQIPATKILTIGADDNWDEFKAHRPLFSKIHVRPDYNPTIKAPVWAWVLQNGRGFLCSTEW
jgi:hypothetical protein